MPAKCPKKEVPTWFPSPLAPSFSMRVWVVKLVKTELWDEVTNDERGQNLVKTPLGRGHSKVS